jgi:hypothetical protein
MHMQIASVANAGSTASLSVLKSANEQPALAGELISKTVEGLIQAQAAQMPVQPVATLGSGTIINTAA